MSWLDDNPPRRPQSRRRRSKPTGLLVLHSAESAADVNPPDTGADSVARFIRDRTDVGSYHFICDADSTINLVGLDQEAYGDGTGSNRFAIHVSGAFEASRWRYLPQEWRDGCIDQMARACLTASRWLENEHGVTVPAVQLTRAESETRPGFISHALRDPARRSDPGAEVVALVVARYRSLTEGDDDSMTPAQEAKLDDTHRAALIAIAEVREIKEYLGEIRQELAERDRTYRDSLAGLFRRCLGIAKADEQHTADADTGRRIQDLLGR